MSRSVNVPRDAVAYKPLTQACCKPAMKDARNHSKSCHWYDVERLLGRTPRGSDGNATL